MRIKHKYKPQPRDNDRRQVKAYAWFPIRGNNEWIWLEYYTKHQMFVNTWGWVTIGRYAR